MAAGGRIFVDVAAGDDIHAGERPEHIVIADLDKIAGLS